MKTAGRIRYALPTLSLTLLILLSPGRSGAQQAGRIEGVVLDAATRSPLAAANVFLKENQSGAFTDREGRFVIVNLPALQDHLIASYIGYQREETPITLRAGETVRIEILLEQQTIEMERVTVTAQRRSESEFRSQKAVTVTGGSTIALRPAGSTADALREVPGVLVQKTTAGHGTPIIRGLIGKDVLLLYNGVRLNKPTFRTGGNQYLSTIDAESLTRMEVVRGPGSVLYGSDAVGGVVNTITQPPPFTEGDLYWRPRLRLRYTSADVGRSVHAAVEHAGSSFSARAGITARAMGNLNPGGAIPDHDPTGYEELGGNAVFAFKLSDRQMLRFDFLQLDQNKVPRYDKYADGSHQTYLYDPQKRFLGMAEYTFSNPAAWMNSLQWNISWQREHEGRIQRAIVDGAPSEKLRVDDDVISTVGTFVQATSIVARRHALRWGLEFYYDTLQSGRTETTPDTVIVKRGAYPDDSRYHQLGVFVSDDIVVGPYTDLTAGLRFSDIWYKSPDVEEFGVVEDRFQNVTGNLGISHRLRPWLNLLASVSRGFRAPNFNDTVVLKASSDWVDAPSPGLEAETSTNYELGAKVEWNSSDVEVFTFYTTLQNLIERVDGTYNGLTFWDENDNGVQDTGEPPIKVNRNVGEAYITGAEIQSRFLLTDRWSLRGNAFYTYGQSTTVGEPMSRIPPLMGLLGIGWRGDETSVELFVRAADRQDRLSARDEDDSRIDPGGTPGWSDWNLRGSRSFGGLRLDLTFGNIFDHAYKEHGSGVYNPGRYVVLSVGWSGGGGM